jgi:hypothetical protein
MSGRGKWGRTALVAIGLAAVHFVIMMFSFMSMLWGTLAGLKSWARGLPSLFFVLGFPGSFIIGRWTEADPNLNLEADQPASCGARGWLLWRWWRVRRAD